MRFDAGRELESVVDGLLSSGDPEMTAKGQNFRWEERIATARHADYQRELATTSFADLDDDHARFVANTVNVNGPRQEPVTFTRENAAAITPKPDGRLTLVRVEDLKDWAKRLFTGDAYDLKRAFDGKDPKFEIFFKQFNQARDRRPVFAAFEGDLHRFSGWPGDWTSLMPDLLGLAHLTASDSDPRPVALLEYKVERVLVEAEYGLRIPDDQRFAAPTIFDHRLNPYFFPSPLPNRGTGINYGRAVNLAGKGTLVCEIVHRHIHYTLADVKEVAVLTRDLTCDVAAIRSAHLASLRKQTGCAGFGAS